MDVKYFDIKQTPNPLFPNGSKITTKELFQSAKDVNPDVFSQRKYLGPSDELSSVKTDTYENKRELLRALNTMIFSLSGQIPSEKEDQLHLESIRRIHEYYKGSDREDYVSSPEFVFGCVPYILTGFATKEMTWSKNGVNSHENLISFVDGIMGKKVKLSSFLCAHKERREIGDDTLMEQIKENGAGRSMNLIKGVVENSPLSRCEVTFIQPGSSYEGMISIFPGIIVNALKKENINDISSILKSQTEQMKELCKNYSDNTINFGLNDVDEHIRLVIHQSQELMGPNYKLLSYSDLKKGSESNHLLKISMDHTLPDILRILPYYENPEYIASLAKKNKSAIDDSNLLATLEYYQEPMTGPSKSVIETLFYYAWGRKSREENQLAVGLDRDHDLFQTLSFSLGHGMNHHMNHHSPLLYARRYNTNKEGGILHQTSFRQFWRE